MARIGIFVGTMYGNALLVAEEAQPILQNAGHEVHVYEDAALSEWQAYSKDVALIVTSTTGQGDLPDSIAGLYEEIREQLGHQPDLRYGVIVLGDTSYEHFCGGGQKFDALLQEHGAKRLGEVLLIDASENPEPEAISSPWIEQWLKLL